MSGDWVLSGDLKPASAFWHPPVPPDCSNEVSKRRVFFFFFVAMTPRVIISRRVSAQVAVHRHQQVQSHRAAHAA